MEVHGLTGHCRILKMGHCRLKWKCIFISYLVFLNGCTRSLPIPDIHLSSLNLIDTILKNEIPVINQIDIAEETKVIQNENNVQELNNTQVDFAVNVSRNNMLRQIRPGQEVRQYAVQITDAGDSFNGRIVLDIVLTTATREDPITLYADNLNIQAVRAGLATEANVQDVGFDLDGGILEIFPDVVASSYIVVIEYNAPYVIGGNGLHKGHFNDGQGNYVAMNLHPTHARRVFPCMDEPTEVSMISFTFNGLDYSHLMSNSMLEENTANQFRALQGPPHVWGMIAHSFSGMNLATNQVTFFARPGISAQDIQASGAISFYYNLLNEWTNKPYTEIVLNQDGRMNIVALPDIDTDWHALSTVGIWEPYMYMESAHSVKQRMTAFYKIANAMAKQWFGYVIYPENWRYEWVVSGLASYAAFEMMSEYQAPLDTDVTRLDVHTLFVTEVIQESLLRDSYAGVQPLEPAEDLFEEDEIRNHLNGLLKYKAPALLKMMRLILSNNPEEEDFIQSAARALLAGRALQTVNSLNFVDAVNSEWLANGNGIVDDFGEYLENWIFNTGYPLLHVDSRHGRVFITQERFGLTSQSHNGFMIPISYTTSVNPNFDNYAPVLFTDETTTIDIFLDEEDWILFNIQGQGYYRVNYDPELWERIIEALEDPERREVIHPLNRATLVDDALNLARAGRLDYDIAFRVVLTMEHETEYAVWKAFVRNMNFLRKQLVALVSEDDDLDQDIYLRMVRRTVGTLENELGFYPDITLTEPAMHTLTRGLVMDHACRANYQPCIAAAVDWFYDPNSNDPVVNPNIPHEIRPAVYCTMVREGDNDVISALYERLNIEPTLYERVVILESLACSRDEGFIRTLLDETIAVNSPYSVEERNRIFVAVAESSFENAFVALTFISMRALEIRNMYGGPEKLEEIIFKLADNMAGSLLGPEFRIWVNAQNNNLDDSQLAALRALEQVNQNLNWMTSQLDDVYEWIDENDASTMVTSLIALCLPLMVALFN